MGLYELATRIGTIGALDRVADPLVKAVTRLVPHGPVKDVLSGTRLGHPLHPLLTDVAIGSFTSSSIVDLVGGRRGQPAANLLALTGLASVVPTAAAGWSDWSNADRAQRRVGLVHAAANVMAAGLFGASVLARRRGRHTRATTLGLCGMGVMTVSGYLGGHLSFSMGTGVNNTFWQHGAEDWTPVLEESELQPGTPVRVYAGDATVLMYRRRTGEVSAISSRCSHAGGPLEEGEIVGDDSCIRCPWHQSVFRLEDGGVVHGPATAPQPAYDVRVEGGKVEIRLRRG